MSRTNGFALPAALLFAALALSACATKPTEAVVEPAPAPAVEQPAAAEPAPEVAPAAEAAAEPAPAPAASTEEVAPKPAVKKARKKAKAKAAAPKVVEPAPVAEPAPAPAPVAAPAPVQEPARPAMVETPIQPVAEQGFLEKYWAWLLGIVIAAIAIVFMMRKKE